MTAHTSPHLREKVPLSEFTTLGVGGPAKYFCTVASELELEQALDTARARQIPILILGGGSNLVIADKGFDGLVVHIALRGLDSEEDGDDVILRCESRRRVGPVGCEQRGKGPCRDREPERNSWICGRHSNSERWGIWSGSREYD